MSILSIDLTWIVVHDLKKAVQYYKDTLGLKLEELNEEFGWAEFSGLNGGCRLGIAQQSEYEETLPGQNAIITLTVQDIARSKKEIAEKGGVFIGDILEVPGHVKLQTIVDQDGNKMQLVQKLSSKA